MKDSEQKNFQHKGQNRIMNETQFIEATEALMDDIEDALERSGLDADVDRSGNVMNIEFDNGEQVVVNRHGPTQQMWLASRRGGLHFSLQQGQWLCTRTAEDFWKALSETVSGVCGQSVELRGR